MRIMKFKEWSHIPRRYVENVDEATRKKDSVYVKPQNIYDLCSHKTWTSR